MSDETNDISKALAIVPPIEVEVVEDYADAAWESSTESAASPVSWTGRSTGFPAGSYMRTDSAVNSAISPSSRNRKRWVAVTRA